MTCSSSRSFQGYNLRPRVMGFVHAFGLIFFFLQKFFFLHLSNLKRIHFAPKLCKKKKYIYICIGRRARSRATDHRTSFPDP